MIARKICISSMRQWRVRRHLKALFSNAEADVLQLAKLLQPGDGPISTSETVPWLGMPSHACRRDLERSVLLPRRRSHQIECEAC